MMIFIIQNGPFLKFYWRHFNLKSDATNFWFSVAVSMLMLTLVCRYRSYPRAKRDPFISELCVGCGCKRFDFFFFFFPQQRVILCGKTFYGNDTLFFTRYRLWHACLDRRPVRLQTILFLCCEISLNVGSTFYMSHVGKEYHCSKIDYFPKDEYTPDPNDSTMAIPCKYAFHNV